MHGKAIEGGAEARRETFEPVELMDTNGQILPGMWKLRVTAKAGRGGVEETAEILVYRP